MYSFTEESDYQTEPFDSGEKSRETLEMIYESYIDKNQYYNFEDWMFDMRRHGLINQDCYPDNQELEIYACEQANKAKFWDDNCNPIERKPTKEEEKLIETMIYSGLQCARYCAVFDHKDRLNFITEAIEFVGMNAIPELNAYQSLTIPIRNYWIS